MAHPISPLLLVFLIVNSRPFLVQARLFSLTLNSIEVIPAKAHRSALDLPAARRVWLSPFLGSARFVSWVHRCFYLRRSTQVYKWHRKKWSLGEGGYEIE